MPRWYLGFYCWAKNRQLQANRFAEQVQHHDLGNHIPVMRVEKGLKQGEFYLFLAIESQSIGAVPDAVQHVLPLFSSLGTPIQKPGSSLFESFTLDQIRNMVGVEHTVRDYAQLIPYVPRKIQVHSDPFAYRGQDPPATNIDIDDEAMLLRSQCYDRLLCWLSATGMGSWQTFQNACHTLGLDGRNDAPARVLRRLRLLGHIETTADRSRWSATPTVLVQSGDDRSCFLCGQRDSALLQMLRNITHIEELPQPRGEAPALIQVHASESDILITRIAQMRQAIHFTGNAALHLARIVPTLAEWKRTLESVPYFSPYQYQAKRFAGAGFIEADFDKRVSGLYQFWPLKQHTSTSDRPEYTFFYDAEYEQFLRGDWYGLRFLARHTSDEECSVVYEAASQRLAVPWDWRWPELYERVLVLASGNLPASRDEWLIYDAITPEILTELMPKLSLEYEETPELCMMS
jgi:hypothetical protein